MLGSFFLPEFYEFPGSLTLVGGVAPAAHYNPPTTACGATSVFETPSVLRESLPSYSAKPGASYAPRALRCTSPRGRTDPFQGTKSKQFFFCRFSLIFKTIWGSKMEAKMKSQSNQNRAWAPSKTLLELGCRAMGFAEANLEIRAPATLRAQFLLISPTAPGGPKSTPIWSPQKGQKPLRRRPDGV